MTGPPERNRQTEAKAKAELGALEPPKNSMGQLMGIRSPQGLSSGIGAHLGLARKLRLLLGMTRNQGPSQGPSATASRSATREDGLRGHNWRSRLPQTSLPGQDRQDLILLKLFLRTGQDIKHVSGDMARHSWP